jgi:hypothetical protein
MLKSPVNVREVVLRVEVFVVDVESHVVVGADAGPLLEPAAGAARPRVGLTVDEDLGGAFE